MIKIIENYKEMLHTNIKARGRTSDSLNEGLPIQLAREKFQRK